MTGRLRRFATFCKQVIKDYSVDNGSLVAAAVSYYVFLSIIPILLLAVAVVGYILGSPEHARAFVFSYVKEYSPVLAEKGGMGAADIVEGIVRGREAATGIGLIALLWSGTSVIAILEQAINVAWNTPAHRGFFGKRVLALVMMLLVGLLLGLSFGVTTALGTFRNLDLKVFGVSPNDLPFIWQFMSYLIPLLVTIATFTLVYKVLPNTFVSMKVAFVGAVFSGILWEAAKYIFSYYVNHFANYTQIYGSLGAIILLLVWINYTSVVTILGAEVASLYAHRRSISVKVD